MTRLALLSDVHANLGALQVVLRSLPDQDVDQVLVAGDLVGYGPQPNECVATLAELGAVCVAGNHDLFVLKRLPPTRFPALARRSAALTRSMLSAEAREFLAALPLTRRVDRVLMAHGSLDDPEEYVLHSDRAAQLLSRLTQVAPGANTLVLGHTHRQWCVDGSREVRSPRARLELLPGARLLNPGSVGQSRQWERRPRARFAVLDTDAATVDFLRLDYDVATARRLLHAQGLPNSCLHLRPGPRRLARRLLKGTTSAAPRLRRGR